MLQASGRRGIFNAFFPHLSTLDIHLENHTAIDFLRNLNPDFCLKITKLRLNTKMVNEDEETEYGNEMGQILGKFENLKSLHLIQPCVNLDLRHLFSVCKRLNDFRVQRTAKESDDDSHNDDDGSDVDDDDE